MDVEASCGENDSSQSLSTNFSEIIHKTSSSHTAIVDNEKAVLHYDPKANQYLQVLNGTDSKNYAHYGTDCQQCKEGLADACLIDVQSLKKLKDSTKKLICLLEEIESKTHTKAKLRQHTQNFAEFLKPCLDFNNPETVTDVIGEDNIKKLENHAKVFDATLIQDPEDDCSVYKRLTRKCLCLNQTEYNDFVIHFNEDSRFFTSSIGEIIKNLRILKKFLYMGKDYTKHALIFLNEGFSESTFTEKVDICQGCSHADICNIFDKHSIVITLISWPCKHSYYGDSISQGLAAAFLYKLAQLEEGRRYLKFSSKITNDIRKVLKTKANKIEVDTLNSLNATLNLLHPAQTPSQHENMSYYCKPVDKGFGSNTLGALVQYRQYMTLDEVMTHLDLLHNLSQNYTGKEELITFLPALLALFKRMLVEYDNSEMNIIITTILNNVVSPSMVKPERPRFPKRKKKVMANTATEPIIMVNGSVQIPPRRPKKPINSGLGGPPNKMLRKSVRKITNLERLKKRNKSSTRIFNTSRKFAQDSRNPFIIVPIVDLSLN